MNLFADAEKLVREHLTAVGVDHSKAVSLEDVLYLALNRGMKRVKPVPRTVHRCKNFDDKLAKLDSKAQAAAAVILGKLERGEDISGHLSKGIDRAGKTDDLLADWNIHHVHISNTKRNPADKFYERSEEVLFIVFTNTGAYCIDVHSHDTTKNPTVWTRQSLFEAMASNWPDLVEKYRLKGIAGSGKPISDAQRKTLRPNTLVPIEFNGNLYFPPGGGLSTANTSLQVGVDADQIMFALKDMEAQIVNKTEIERQRFADSIGVPVSNVDFALVEAGPENWQLIETNSKHPMTGKIGHPFR
jgi:hypothetical protein